MALGRTLTGAWIETIEQDADQIMLLCRTLTGAWIETLHGCGGESHTHGCVD